MRATVPFGRIVGIPVGAHWSALVGVVLLGQLLALNVLPALAPGHGAATYLLAGGAAALVFVLSLLAHELAHAVVAAAQGSGSAPSPSGSSGVYRSWRTSRSAREPRSGSRQ